jgi:hypothetical protein
MLFFPSFYVVRPSTALAGTKLPKDPPWAFSKPMLFRTYNPGDHDYEGQRSEGETFFKLAFLAHVDSELLERERPSEAGAGENGTSAGPTEGRERTQTPTSELRVLLGTPPYTVETFDRLWRLEYAGPFLNDERDMRRLLPAASLRAVRPPPRAAGVGGRFIHVLRPLEEQWDDTLVGDDAWRSIVAATLRAAIGWLRDARKVRRVLVLVGGAACPAALLASIGVPGVEWHPKRPVSRDSGDEGTATIDFLGMDWDEGVARVEAGPGPLSRKRGPVDQLVFEVSHEAAGVRIGRGWLERTVREPISAESTPSASDGGQ